MRIGVAGLSGRMGRLVAEMIPSTGATLIGGTSRGVSPPDGVVVYLSIGALAAACDAIVDFTHPATLTGHADAVAASGTAWILGTTGLSEADAAQVRAAARHAPVVQAANFAPGLNLVLLLAERLARALPAAEYDAEIIEMHHRHKRDAPSGTALALGHAVAAGRGMTASAVADMAPGRRDGPRRPGGIGFASLRGGQVVGDHGLLFAGDDEHISLSHSARDRAVFAKGAVRAALWAGAGRAPGLYGMRDVLASAETDGEIAP